MYDGCVYIIILFEGMARGLVCVGEGRRAPLLGAASLLGSLVDLGLRVVTLNRIEALCDTDEPNASPVRPLALFVQKRNKITRDGEQWLVQYACTRHSGDGLLLFGENGVMSGTVDFAPSDGPQSSWRFVQESGCFADGNLAFFVYSADKLRELNIYGFWDYGESRRPYDSLEEEHSSLDSQDEDWLEGWHEAIVKFLGRSILYGKGQNCDGIVTSQMRWAARNRLAPVRSVVIDEAGELHLAIPYAAACETVRDRAGDWRRLPASRETFAVLRRTGAPKRGTWSRMKNALRSTGSLTRLGSESEKLESVTVADTRYQVLNFYRGEATSKQDSKGERKKSVWGKVRFRLSTNKGERHIHDGKKSMETRVTEFLQKLKPDDLIDPAYTFMLPGHPDPILEVISQWN